MDVTLNVIVDEKYKIVRQLGAGSYGQVFLAINIQTGEEVALKTEKRGERNHSYLFLEHRLYDILKDGIGFPAVHQFIRTPKFNALVMDLLGPSLEQLFNMCKRRFTLKTVLMFADQMIQRLEYIHEHGYVHSDVKPDNILLGAGFDTHLMFIVDFGLAKQYRHPITEAHYPMRKGMALTGTARFASLNTHIYMAQTRRDDMESLGLVLMYFNRGSLPWQGLVASNTAQRHDKIFIKKMATSTAELCRGFPNEFVLYMDHCRKLRHGDTPNYKYLRFLFQNLFYNSNFQYDNIYDWTFLQPNRQADQWSLTEAVAGFNKKDKPSSKDRGERTYVVALMSEYNEFLRLRNTP